MPEAKLAREAEICYQTVAMVTDYDCWNTEVPHVTLEEIKKIFDVNLTKMQDVISQYLLQSSNEICDQACEHGCNNALDGSIVTHKECWDNDRLKKLKSILSRYI